MLHSLSHMPEAATAVVSDRDPPYRYKRLFKRFVLLTLVCSVVPLLLVGWIISNRYQRSAETRVMAAFRNEMQHHRKVSELFLKDHRSKLELMAQSNGRQDFLQPGRLRSLFDSKSPGHGKLCRYRRLRSGR